MAFEKKTAPPPLNRLMPAELVTVRANNHLNEEDGFHAKGSEFQLRKDRLAALGAQVSLVEKKEAPDKG